MWITGGGFVGVPQYHVELRVLSWPAPVDGPAQARWTCENWYAYHDFMPGSPPTLHVRARCTAPTTGYHFALLRAEPPKALTQAIAAAARRRRSGPRQPSHHQLRRSLRRGHRRGLRHRDDRPGRSLCRGSPDRRVAPSGSRVPPAAQPDPRGLCPETVAWKRFRASTQSAESRTRLSGPAAIR